MRTLQLNTNSWDLVADPFGNIALATDAASIAQDVASAIRTFLGECWYDTTLGMPYLQSILGQYPVSSFIKDNVEQAALTVQGVTGVTVAKLALSGRQLTGTVYVTTSTDSTPIEVNF